MALIAEVTEKRMIALTRGTPVSKAIIWLLLGGGVAVKRRELGCKLVLFTDWNLHMDCRMVVPKSVTLNDLEHRNDRRRRALSLQ